MIKYIFQILLVAAFAANSFACDVAIPATDGEVRTFRGIFKTEIEAEMASEHLQYEAIGIFSFINKWINKGFDEARLKELNDRFWTTLRGDLFAIDIAEAVRLGYGFDRGVCSDLPVSPAEMNAYRGYLTGIGQHVSKTSQRAEPRHVFTTSASDATIAAHVRVSNALTYKANEAGEDRAYVRFIYADASLSANRELEATVTLTGEDAVTKARVQEGKEIAKALLGLGEEAVFEVSFEEFERLAELNSDQLAKVRAWYEVATGKEDIEARMRLAIMYSFLPNGPEAYADKWGETRTYLNLVDDEWPVTEQNSLPRRKRPFTDVLGILCVLPVVYEGGSEAFVDLLSIAALLDALPPSIPPAQQAESAQKVAYFKLSQRVSNQCILQYLALPSNKLAEVNMAWDECGTMSDEFIQAIKERDAALGALTKDDCRTILNLTYEIENNDDRSSWVAYLCGHHSRTLENAKLLGRYVAFYLPNVDALATRLEGDSGNLTEADCENIRIISGEFAKEESDYHKQCRALSGLIGLSSGQLVLTAHFIKNSTMSALKALEIADIDVESEDDGEDEADEA